MERKKKWIRPRLILLLRARPEENVLLACKGSIMSGPQRPGNWACQHPVQGPCHTQANS
jgi:hypothetical protein